MHMHTFKTLITTAPGSKPIYQYDGGYSTIKQTMPDGTAYGKAVKIPIKFQREVPDTIDELVPWFIKLGWTVEIFMEKIVHRAYQYHCRNKVAADFYAQHGLLDETTTSRALSAGRLFAQLLAKFGPECSACTDYVATLSSGLTTQKDTNAAHAAWYDEHKDDINDDDTGEDDTQDT